MEIRLKDQAPREESDIVEEKEEGVKAEKEKKMLMWTRIAKPAQEVSSRRGGFSLQQIVLM